MKTEHGEVAIPMPTLYASNMTLRDYFAAAAIPSASQWEWNSPTYKDDNRC